MHCPVCQHENPSTAHFCSACGARLHPSETPAAERKRVTILFADIVNSTALAGEYDAETVHEIYNGALQRMSQAVTQMGGTVGVLMGDGMMAFFGAPTAHEDDPERAALTGQAILAALRDYTPHQIASLQVRIGINTGLVMMGEMGGGGRTVYTAVGDAVNLASRLEAAAAPNTILVGEATWKHLQHRFDGEPLEPLAVKGLQQPVAIYRLGPPKAQPGTGRGLSLEGMRAPLIGRDDDYQTLLGQLPGREEHNRQGGVTFIIGEAGLGKSRLVAEVAKVAEVREIHWLEGRSLSYTQQQPYAPWAHLIRQWLGAEGESDESVLLARLRDALHQTMGERGADHLPFLAVLLSLRDTGRMVRMEPEARNVRLRLSMVQWLAALARQRPLVLIFEDLHWADPSSLALLEQVTDLTLAYPMRLLIVTRPTNADKAMALRGRAKSRLNNFYGEIWLNPLDAQESDDLIAALLRWQAPPADLLDKISFHAEGNPFFVEEILRTLIEDGILVNDGASWQLTRSLEQVRLSATVEGVLTTRIDRLNPADKEVLQRASVVGRVFWRRLLAEMGQPTPTTAESLYQLSRLDLVRPRGWREVWENEYIFRHALVQEAAYRSIPHARRRTYHRDVAKAMESLLRDDTQDYDSVLAHHWHEADQPEQAIPYFLKAARAAADRFANNEAISLYNRALDLLVTGDQFRRWDILEQVQLLYERIGDSRQRQQTLDEMLTLAQSWGDERRLARAQAYRYIFDISQGAGMTLPRGSDEPILRALQIGGATELLLEVLELTALRYWWGYSFPFDRTKGLARQQQALMVAEQWGDLYRLHLNRAMLADMRGAVPEAQAALHQALDSANQQGDLRKQWTAYHRLGRLWMQANPDNAIIYHQKAMAIGRQMGDTRLELISADNLGQMAFTVGVYELAYTVQQRAGELQQQRGQSQQEQAYGLNKVVAALLRAGQVAQAQALAGQVATMSAHETDSFTHFLAQLYGVEAARHQQQRDTVMQFYTAFNALNTDALPLPAIMDGVECYIAAEVGQWHREQGDLPTAEQFLIEALRCFDLLPAHPMRDDEEYRLNVIGHLLIVQAALGNPEPLRLTLERAEETLSAYKGSEWPLTPLHWGRHLAYAALTQPDKAAEARTQAQTLVERHSRAFESPAWVEAFLDLPLHREILS